MGVFGDRQRASGHFAVDLEISFVMFPGRSFVCFGRFVRIHRSVNPLKCLYFFQPAQLMTSLLFVRFIRNDSALMPEHWSRVALTA